MYPLSPIFSLRGCPLFFWFLSGFFFFLFLLLSLESSPNFILSLNVPIYMRSICKSPTHYIIIIKSKMSLGLSYVAMWNSPTYFQLLYNHPAISAKSKIPYVLGFPSPKFW